MKTATLDRLTLMDDEMLASCIAKLSQLCAQLADSPHDWQQPYIDALDAARQESDRRRRFLLR